MKVYFITEDQYESFCLEHKDYIFRAVHFGHSTDKSEHIITNAEISPIGEKRYEVWVSDTPIKTFEKSGHVFYESENLIYTCFESIEDTTDLESITCELYSTIFEISKSLDIHPARLWNYIPNILNHAAKIERYRQFNIGRRNAWEQNGPKEATGQVIAPAATGIGALGGPLKIEVIFSRAKPIHIQNSRQINAYNYSEIYGPKPPTFSRATYLPGTCLFISGTASIVGEKTVHIDDPTAQTIETLDNIRHLISSENLGLHNINKNFLLHDVTDWRIYIKHLHQAPTIEQTFNMSMPDLLSDYILLRDDICRDDLLVEIEATILLSK